MTGLPGITGTLFPGRYLCDRLLQDALPAPAQPIERRRQQLVRWWLRVEAVCGPVSGLRTLFDLVAMPLFGMLGYRASHARFGVKEARAFLETREGVTAGLILLPWAARPSLAWKDLVDTAREAGGSWCFLLAPPFLSLIDGRGHATRHSVDFMLPNVLTGPSFARFWTLAHAIALAPTGPGSSTPSRIDTLVDAATRYQDRVREDLQVGVTEALCAFGGVVTPPTSAQRFDEALTLVYRVLFLLFAESRELVPLHDPIYGPSYAIGALCRDAHARDSHRGLWNGLAAITRLSRLGCRTGELIVDPFNGRLFARNAAPTLERTRGPRSKQQALRQDLAAQTALIALGSRKGAGGREQINYRDLGVEELGAVYERVLDLDPEILSRQTTGWNETVTARRARHSARRKQTGTFYTPRPLAEFVVRRTLAPLVAGRSANEILALRVVDPAMGSGAFLVAACRYLAVAYQQALCAEGCAAASDFDEDERADVRRLVAERCIAGVDVNPVAVQLARLSLWLTTLSRGKPLGFLDHRLRAGNSLIGAYPDDLFRVPSRRINKAAPSLPLFDASDLERVMQRVVGPLSQLSARRDASIDDVRAKKHLWERLSSDTSPLHRWRLASSIWCARWFWPGGNGSVPSAPELRAILDAVLKDDTTLPPARLRTRITEAARAEAMHGFFHWTLEFADLFYDEGGQPKSNPGFDAVIGNPPWEMLREGSVQSQANISRFVRESGGYPSCDRGHMNLYQPFVERSLSLCRRGGRVGLVVPWGLAVDEGAIKLRRRLIEQSALSTVVGLDNAHGLFPIHRGLRFMTIVASRGESTGEIRARFGVKDAEELDQLPGRDREQGGTAYPVRLTHGQIQRISGPSLRLPDIRRPDDLNLLERVAVTFPALGSPEGWGARFGRELNATEDRDSFGPNGLAVLEGKHLEPFRVRIEKAATRIDLQTVQRLLPDRRFEHARLGYRDVSGVGNRLSLIAAIVPAGAVTTHTIFCLRSPIEATGMHFLCALFNSYVLNAVVRMLMGGHVTTSLVESLPVPVFRGSAGDLRIALLSRQLTDGRGNASILAELQAAVARLYQLRSSELSRLLDGFPLVAREERDQVAKRFEAARDATDVAPRLDRS